MGCTDEGGSDREAPTIRVESCRGDGRCPECGYVGEGGYRFTSVAICGCVVCVICEPVHLRVLLTEALRQRDERDDAITRAAVRAQERLAKMVALEGERDDWWRKYNAAKVAADVMEGERDAAIRQRDDYSDRAKASMLIAESRNGPGHDCFFREERDAAIADAAGLRESRDEAWARTEFVTQERDAQREAQNDAYATEREKARLWNDLVRERDEARHRLGEAAMELPEIAGPVHHRIQKFREMFSAQITKARERAEKAEALLREVMGEFPGAHNLVAKIREALKEN